MKSILIQNLINYAKKYLELDDVDELYVRNRLLEACCELDYEDVQGDEIGDLDCPDSVIDPILDELINTDVIKPEERELYLCKLLDIVSLKPSEITRKFNEIKSNKGTASAMKWLHLYSEHNSYIKLTDIRKNLRWFCEGEKGGLEITINLSKPEKTVSDVKKAFLQKPKYPKCLICPENMGYAGHGTTRQNLRGIDLKLMGEDWFWQFSPYAYFNEHGIAINKKHTPMVVNEYNVNKLLDFIDFVPEYFIGFNAALPIVGGSILAHDHYQGGRYNLPVFNSTDRFVFEKKEYPDVKVSILNWYNSVIRLTSKNRINLEKAATELILSWKSHDDIENNIISYDSVEHNSITAICRYDNEYILDLILRNNITSELHPEGVYHAHEKYYNIKREAIGLIEAGGMFILPARLKRQLAIVSDVLQGKTNVESLQEDMSVHMPMIERLVKSHGMNNSKALSDNIVKEEVERICKKILDNTAVFKDNPVGINGFKKFIIKNGYGEK